MKTTVLFVTLLSLTATCVGQTLQQRLQSVVGGAIGSDQLKHAVLSLYIVETETGKVVFHLNEETGVAPASTQKIFTSIAAFELLGHDYRFKTEIGYDGTITNGILNGDVIITGYGDPTFGSFRFPSTRQVELKKKLSEILQQAHITAVRGNLILDQSHFSYQPLPGGWIWDDIGNYYGAGTWALNWNENQYDLILKPGKREGDPVLVADTSISPGTTSFINLLTTGIAGSGDNGYIYLPPYSRRAFVTGTEGSSKNTVTISGALPDPAAPLTSFIDTIFHDTGIDFNGKTIVLTEANKELPDLSQSKKLLGTIVSPPLDSINYWFLQKSINLYGEALTKTLAYEKAGFGETEEGIKVLHDFWAHNGIDVYSLNIFDGSGLSPQNRVTTKAMVTALQFAKNRKWFPSFYQALPIYNGMKMKSGTITGAKAFSGYHTSSKGVGYTYSIIINNFDESKGSVVPLMYKILNELK